MPTHKTRYAKSGDVNIAYQVIGDGPLDIVFVMGWVSNIDHMWLEPSFARFLNGLASFSRLIIFDKRGTGLSDRVPADRFPTLEERMDDVRAVMDAARSERAALIGISEGGPMCALFAATYPERTQALIIIGGFARDEGLHALTAEERDDLLRRIEKYWGWPVAIHTLRERAPSRFDDEGFRQWWDSYLRAAASPAAAVAHARMSLDIDVRHVLPAIRVPALVIHAAGDQVATIEGGRYLAQHIPGAKYVELNSRDHLPWVSDADAVLGEIEEFLTGERPHREPERVLATVLYTDIVSSTEQLASVGDRAWHDLLDAHHAVVRKELARFRGREVNTTGDGFLATFDGPARAIRCARADPGRCVTARRPGARGTPHGRVRDHRRRYRWHRRAHGRARRRNGRRRRSTGFEHRERPRRWLRHRVRRPRDTRPQRGSRRVANLRCHSRLAFDSLADTTANASTLRGLALVLQA